MDTQLEEYLRRRAGLQMDEETLEGADPGDMDRSLSPEPLALRERPRFNDMLGSDTLQNLRSLSQWETRGEDMAADELAEAGGQQLLAMKPSALTAPLEARGVTVAAGGRMPLPAGRGMPADEGSGGGYLDALRRAQRMDDLSAAVGRNNAAMQQLAGVTSRGVFQPQALPPMPSEVSKEAQRRQAVAEYLRQQRDEETAAADNALKRAHADFYGKPKPPPPAKPGLTQKQLDERHAAELALKAAQTAAAGRANRPQPTKPPAPAKDRGLPASEVKDLADFDTATEQLDDLLKNFDSLNMGGIGGKLGGKATDWLGLQGTDSAAYLADARRAMQAVGTILEGGKLAAGDEVKYRRMLPEPGDPPELAKRKVDGLKQLLANLRAKREQRFKASGFGDAAQPASKVAVSNGSETLYIDPQDVPAAEADGYKVVKP